MTTTDIWTYLTALDYPASKADVVACAEAANAPQEHIETLQSVSGESFSDRDALHAAIAERA